VAVNFNLFVEETGASSVPGDNLHVPDEVTDKYYHVRLYRVHLVMGRDIFSGYRVYGAERHFQQHFSNIVAISFIGGGNQSTRRKSPTCHKSMTNFIT